MPDQFERQPEHTPWNQPGDQDNTHRKIPPTAAVGQSGPGWPSVPATPPVSMTPPPPAETFGSFATGTPLPPPPPLLNPYDVPPTAPVHYPTYAPMSAPTPGYGQMYPPVYLPATPTAKKPIYFPLTRKKSVLLQIFTMLIYSVIIALSIMGCALYLQNSSHPGTSTSIYTNLDGSTNVLAIVLTVVIVLLVLPACSLLSGALFGSWRGLFVSLLSLGGGIFLTYLVNHQFALGDPSKLRDANSIQGYAVFAALPVAGLVVGLIYDRRRYAAWWKSMFTIMLGSAVLVIWLAVAIFALSANSSSFLNTSSSSGGPQTTLTALGIGLGCFALLAIPVLTFPIACVEGIIHARIAAGKQK